MDLFDDLPEPTRTPGPVLKEKEEEEENKNGGRLKRKREEEEEGEEERDATNNKRVEEEEEDSANNKRIEEEEEDANNKRVEEEEEEKERKRRETLHKVCREGVPLLKGHWAARKGEREEMQDAHILMPNMNEILSDQQQGCRVSYFAVFDGHGGSRASRFAAENLHLNLAKKFPTGDAENVDKLIKRCVLDTFRQTDEEFLKRATSQKPAWKDGSTATCVLVMDDMVYVANLGDSRAVLCRMDPSIDANIDRNTDRKIDKKTDRQTDRRRSLTLALSKEHNPTIYEERMRIQRAGGTVRDGRVLGVLEVSRSLGDGQYKRIGVISTPDIRRCQLTANDRFIMVACDGLFKVFSADEAVKFVLNIVQEDSVDQSGSEDGRFESACQQLASEAVRRGCADNVTVIIISITH